MGTRKIITIVTVPISRDATTVETVQRTLGSLPATALVKDVLVEAYYDVNYLRDEIRVTHQTEEDL